MISVRTDELQKVFETVARWPSPDDAACDQIVEEERLRKYGEC